MESKLDIAVLTTSFPLAHGEAGGVFIQRLIEAMPEGLRFSVLVPAPDYADAVRGGERYSVTLFRYAPVRFQVLAHKPGGIPAALGGGLGFLLLPGFLAAMFAACFLAGRRADLIHANWSVNGMVAGLAGWLLGKPVLTTLRGTDIASAKKSKAYALVLRLCLRLSAKVVVVSRAMQEALIQEFPRQRGKIVFIPNGVGQEFLSLARDADRPPSRLLAVGNLTANKNILAVLAALKQLSDEGRDMRLEVIGEGPERASLEAFASEQGVADRVRFSGQQDQSYIVEALRRADVFVLASFSEGRPNALVEAMAAGLPVVASDIGGVRELVEAGANGLLFAPDNPSELAGQLRHLCEDAELRAGLARQARQYIIDNRLSWTEAARQYAGLYHDMVGSH